MQDNVDDADAIVSKSVNLPGGVFKAGVQSGRLIFDVLPAGAERDVIWGMFKVAVDTDYLPKLRLQTRSTKPNEPLSATLSDFTPICRYKMVYESPGCHRPRRWTIQ